MAGTETEFTFEIVDRFKKTKQILEGENAANIENFEPFITYDFRCMRLGKPISPQEMKAINQEVTLNISWDYINDSPFSNQSILPYAILDPNNPTCLAEQALQTAFTDPTFADKYKNFDYVKQNYYEGMYSTIQEIATYLKNETLTSSGKPNFTPNFWRNSKGQCFAPQFNDPTTGTSITSQKVKLDAEGKGTFSLYLN